MRKGIWIILIIIDLVIVGYFLFFSKSPLISINSTDKEALSKCQSISDTVAKNDCYEQVAVANEDLSICDKIEKDIPNSGIIGVNFCYAEVAGATGDLSICQNKVPQNNIRDQCYWNVAVHDKDFSLCEDFVIIDNYACIIEVAMERKNISECEQFEYNDRNYCRQGVAYGTLDKSYCDMIEPSFSSDIEKCKQKIDLLMQEN